MDRLLLLEFARRDRSLVEALRAAHWRAWQRAASPRAALELAEELRRHAQALRPGWPDERERELDLAVHRRVAEALGRASRCRRG